MARGGCGLLPGRLTTLLAGGTHRIVELVFGWRHGRGCVLHGRLTTWWWGDRALGREVATTA
jgi:hypothetical protein